MVANREEMILQNMPLVTFVVGRMSNGTTASTLDRDEAIAYGQEGLIQAVDHFDSERGTTFASFAIQRIRGSILDAIRRMDVLPRSLRRSSREVERANLELVTMLGRWPTGQELAIKLGIPLKQLKSTLGHSSARVVSLDKIMTESKTEGAAPWEASDQAEFADPANATDHRADMELLKLAIGSLPDRDKEIVLLRYGQGLPFHEIGAMLNLSESRVCQLHKRILTNLRDHLEKDLQAAA